MSTFSPQYTYFHSDPNDEKPNYVNEHVLHPTLSWTSNNHFTNPLSLPLYNTPYDNEECITQLYLLTAALTLKQFTQIGYRRSLIKFTAPEANDYSIDYYDHNIIRPNEDIFLNNDPFANPQLTEKLFVKIPYTFTLNILNKNTTTSSQQHYVIFMLMIHALTNLTTFQQPFISLTFSPKEMICTVHTKSCYELNKHTHTYTYYKFIRHHHPLNTPARQPHHRYQYINSKYTSLLFLNFTYYIKDTNLQGTLQNYDTITQMYIFCLLSKLLNVDESRPLIVPHEFLQPVEVPILEFIYKTRDNHKSFNLIQSTPYEQSPSTEELNIIKALELL